MILETGTEPADLNGNCLDTFKTYIITHGKISPGVAKDYAYAVGKFLRWVASPDPTETQAMQYYRYLQEKGFANSSIANTVFALNHYFHFLGKKVHLIPPKKHKRQPSFLTVEEAQALTKVISNLRDRAIIMALLYTGMRVNELCSLDMEDLHLEMREIVVRDTKTYNDRKVIISEKCVHALHEYLDTSPDNGRKAVFTSRKGGRISRGRVCAMIKKYGRLAGIGKNVTPHVLRHTLATNMILHGASVIEVKEQLGHRNLESTMRYVHLQTNARKKLYEEHCPPF